MFHRLLTPTKSNSYFIFGARGTGKTTFLKDLFSSKKTLFIDLLDPAEEDLFARNPNELADRVNALRPAGQWVIIDKVQKAPRLLDLVHKLIESTPHRFVLTGSSGRKLKRGVSNLLAGRAFVYHLFPLTHGELGASFNLQQALEWGTLPKIYRFNSASDRADYLRAYALTYLKEEIVAEQIVRNLDPFRLFLEVAAQTNGKIVNYSNIARDIGVDTKTVQSYFSILEETLIGLLLPAYHASVRKRQRTNPKFYFFDCGVKRALDRTLQIGLKEGTYAFGEAFEHFIILEITRLSAYQKKDWQFSYLRTKDDAEIDLVIDRPGLPKALIEIKSTTHIIEKDTTGIARFAKDMAPALALCISRDEHEKKINDVRCLPWQTAFKVLGLV
ncbi:MAG: ATP-binding protein [Chitinivibrionales bacterium]|nr:ATP-binding protein [Chitinivibrionales bacterium]